MWAVGAVCASPCSAGALTGSGFFLALALAAPTHSSATAAPTPARTVQPLSVARRALNTADLGRFSAGTVGRGAQGLSLLPGPPAPARGHDLVPAVCDRPRSPPPRAPRRRPGVPPPAPPARSRALSPPGRLSLPSLRLYRAEPLATFARASRVVSHTRRCGCVYCDYVPQNAVPRDDSRTAEAKGRFGYALDPAARQRLGSRVTFCSIYRTIYRVRGAWRIICVSSLPVDRQGANFFAFLCQLGRRKIDLVHSVIANATWRLWLLTYLIFSSVSVSLSIIRMSSSFLYVLILQIASYHVPQMRTEFGRHILRFFLKLVESVHSRDVSVVVPKLASETRGARSPPTK